MTYLSKYISSFSRSSAITNFKKKIYEFNCPRKIIKFQNNYKRYFLISERFHYSFKRYFSIYSYQLKKHLHETFYDNFTISIVINNKN